MRSKGVVLCLGDLSWAIVVFCLLQKLHCNLGLYISDAVAWETNVIIPFLSLYFHATLWAEWYDANSQNTDTLPFLSHTLRLMQKHRCSHLLPLASPVMLFRISCITVYWNDFPCAPLAPCFVLLLLSNHNKTAFLWYFLINYRGERVSLDAAHLKKCLLLLHTFSS